MKYSISSSKALSYLEVTLNPQETLKYEVGAMIYHDSAIEIKGKSNSGVVRAMAKGLLGGENFFAGFATNNGNVEAKIAVAPKAIGEVVKIDINDTQWYLNDGAFLASTQSVDLKIVRQKGLIRGMFANTGGFFILKSVGKGTLFVNSFGEVKEIELKGKDLVVDTGHIIAWQESLDYKVKTSSGMFNSFKSGEGLITVFSGYGKVLLQSRSPESFVDLLLPFIPQQKGE